MLLDNRRDTANSLGLVSSYAMGGFIHLLLIIAIIVAVVGFLQGRRAG